jgi:hypothetical protein
VQLDRLGRPLEHDRAQALGHEQPRHQPQRRRADEDVSRLRRRLDAGGEVGGVADRQRLTAIAAGERADDDRSGVDAHPCFQPHLAAFDLPASGEGERALDLQAGAHGALGVVLVGAGKAEVGDDAVALVLGDVAVVAGDLLAADPLVGGEEVGEILGVELLAQLGRADHVAEHHRQLAPLAVDQCRRLWRHGVAEAQPASGAEAGVCG